jgi:RimJ/RimL family protein N-acetyltransferase
MDIPVLETERLILRGYRPEDAPAVAALQGNEDVQRHMGGHIDATLKGAYAKMLNHTALWHFRGFGKWAVEEKTTGRCIGRVGLLDYPYQWPGLELGWTLLPDTWGKGYASEAGKAALDWGFEVLEADCILSMIQPANTASINVAQKLGETYWKDFDDEDGLQQIWRITRDEWMAGR